MAAKGESRQQAYDGTVQALIDEASRPADRQHTIQDSYAWGHDYGPWTEDNTFGGLGFWGVVKHEFGDWLPSPVALWGALKGSIDDLRDLGASPGSTLNPVRGGSTGSGSPGRTPNCIGCITPPGSGLNTRRPRSMPDPSKVDEAPQ